jgi:fructokinase
MRIGIDLGGTKIEGILLADDGSVSEKIRVDTPADNYQKTVNALCNVVMALQTSAGKNCKVGIGTPGALTPITEIMKNCNSICLNGKPLKNDIESQLGYEIVVENDANCFALSEACYGAAKGSATVFGVILGTGTGGGLVNNKRLHTGPNRIAGEWGHNSIPDSVRRLIEADRKCYCGRDNCIETVLSGRGLKQSHLERSGNSLEARKIAVLADSGDKVAGQSIDVYCQQLARCLSTVINLYDPEMIVLGGGLSNISTLYEKVPGYLEGFVFTERVLTKLAAPKFGDASGALGAACLWPIEK